MDALVVTFLVIGALALVLLLLSLVGGHTHLGHADFGHADFGHADFGHADFGHADFGHAGVGHAGVGHPDAGHPDLAHGGAGHSGFQLTLPAIAGFIGAFGFGGAIAAVLWPGRGGSATLVACLVGLVAAVPTSWAAGRLVNAAMDMPTDATPTSSDVLGALGTVTSAVPAGGYGAVRLEVAGQQVRYHARCRVALEPGTSVFVIDVPSPTSVVVEPMSQIR